MLVSLCGNLVELFLLRKLLPVSIYSLLEHTHVVTLSYHVKFT